MRPQSEPEWSKKEKEIAHRAYRAAYERECAAIEERMRMMVEGPDSRQTYGRFSSVMMSKAWKFFSNAFVKIILNLPYFLHCWTGGCEGLLEAKSI